MQKLGFMLAMAFILIGALNWLAIGVTKVNVLESILGRGVARMLYIVVGIAALTLLFNRDTYLPFLGETAVPCSLIPEQLPEGADTKIDVRAYPGAKVLYWAAEPATEGMKKINDWRGAYLKYMNAGVVTANADGVATLYVRNPQPYDVPWKGRLEPHVHFRVCSANADADANAGLMGRIETVYVSDGHY